ncbi:ankyrin repeat domain-containing protein 7-like [Microtus oregoni]|uniref:ankyrin repeat domain-containing protein 7-like n=1 Tax=Microtus oregoni TaxID=111838 RepID=UPI001BB1DB96|nr:ankyrin repeat domain-containing protein 7-like [Microtus oregoni]
MQEDMEYDALTIRAPQRSPWYTHLWPACLGRGCLGRRQQRFPLYLIGYDPVGRLQRAASVGDVKLVERLINAREHRVNECDRRSRSSLHYASAHNHPNVVTLLLSNDSTDINMKDDEGCTPLIKAAQRDNVECISILLMHGADPHIVDANGDAALHHAICRGNIPVVSKLLEYNVDIKAKTEYGLTPYKLALFENQLKMAEFLIENGADAPSELTPNSGGAAAVESEQSMKTCANSNEEHGKGEYHFHAAKHDSGINIGKKQSVENDIILYFKELSASPLSLERLCGSGRNTT